MTRKIIIFFLVSEADQLRSQTRQELINAYKSQLSEQSLTG